jgi:DNA polymerase III epsilon subunit-like protein
MPAPSGLTGTPRHQDVETHDWLRDTVDVWGTGRFGHKTGSAWETLAYQRIVQISWVIYHSAGSNTPRSSYVYGSDRVVHPLATKHHGISNDEVWAHGHAIEVVLGEFIADCAQLRQDGGQLAAYAIEFDATIIYCELERIPELRHHCPLIESLAISGLCVAQAAAKKTGWKVPHSTPIDYYYLSLQHAWTRYVALPVSRPRDRYLHGRWDQKLAHNSDYDIAKALELALHL